MQDLHISPWLKPIKCVEEDMFKSNLKILRLLGLLEGISFLLLLGVSMPMKYIWKNEMLMQPIGMAHGVLFLAYVAWVFIVASEYKQKFSFIFWGGLASLLPFGTFVADARLFKPLESNRGSELK